MPPESGPPSDVPHYTGMVIAMMNVAARAESDFSGWLAHVVAKAAKNAGGWDKLERRPGSWEAALVEQLISVEVMIDPDRTLQ
jgi:hypothetical protein